MSILEYRTHKVQILTLPMSRTSYDLLLNLIIHNIWKQIIKIEDHINNIHQQAISLNWATRIITNQAQNG